MRCRLSAIVLLQIVVLHTLDGKPLRVDANKVDVFRPTTRCDKHAGAAVSVGSNNDMCVKETPEEICAIIKRFKKCEDQ